jgi:hypothetical protein
MMQTIFDLSGLLVLPFWALIVFAPRWRWTERLMRSPLVVAGPAVCYAVLVAPRMIELWPALANPTLPGIIALLGTPEGATIAWLHFLAFDLFVARWVYLDARERGITAWLVSPVLVLVLMFGPLGFLLYLAIRAVHGWATGDKTGSPAGDAIKSALTGDHSLLAVFTLAMVALLVVCLAGIALDPRTITGVSAWLKPAKFAASTAIYGATLLWILPHLRRFPRTARAVSIVSAVGLAVEMVVIVGQAARGTTSHFNNTTPLDSALFAIMGTFIAFIWAMNLVAAVLALRERFDDKVFGWSVRLGLILALSGVISGVLMVLPTPEQRAEIARGTRPTIVGAHTVGLSDGGPGLPGVGWSTQGGDHRVAHFLGLHGLQAMPLLAWLLRRKRLTEMQRVRLLFVGAAGYLGVVALLSVQALRGQPLVAPDGITIALFAALAVGVVVAAGIVLRRGADRNGDSIAEPLLS